MSDKIRVYLFVSQNTAVKAGKTRYDAQPVDIDPATLTEAERNELVQHHAPYDSEWKKVHPNAAYYVIGGNGITYTPIAEATEDTLRVVLDELAMNRAREDAKRQAAQEKEIAQAVVEATKWLDLPQSKWWSMFRGTRNLDMRIWGIEKLPTDHPLNTRIQEESKRRRAWLEQERERLSALEEAQKRQAIADAQAAADRRKTQLADAVKRLGTNNQRARWADGVLPQREAIDLIVNEALAPRDKLNGITVLTETGSYCPCGEGIEYDWTEKRTLSAAQYETVTAVKKTFGDGWTYSYHHGVAECHECGRIEVDTLDLHRKVGEVEVRAEVDITERDTETTEDDD